MSLDFASFLWRERAVFDFERFGFLWREEFDARARIEADGLHFADDGTIGRCGVNVDLIEPRNDFAIHGESLLRNVAIAQCLGRLRLEPSGKERNAVEEVFEIGRRELRRFEQDFASQDDFADIVQEGCEAEFFEEIRRELDVFEGRRRGSVNRLGGHEGVF